MPNGYHPLTCYAVGLSSGQNAPLAWCRLPVAESTYQLNSLKSLAECVQADLVDELPVALGFAWPLVIDVQERSHELTSAHEGEGERPWLAGAGAQTLAVGLAQCAWLFDYLALTNAPVRPTFAWEELIGWQANVLIWEAFVADTRGDSIGLDDACRAAQAFQRAIAGGKTPASCLCFTAPYSLAGAALLRAGLSTDLSLLRQPCIVVRP